MKVAWIGPIGIGGGVPTMGALLLEGTLKAGVEVHFYTADYTPIPDYLLAYKNLQVKQAPSWWHWGKWYSRKQMTAFLSSMIARPQAYRRLCDMIRENHAAEPYDCIFQFSQIELFNLGRRGDKLPPIIVYPCVHAAGELHWHRVESKYAREYEGTFMHYGVRAMLMYRSFVQKRAVRKPALIIGMSNRFNELIAEDYDLPHERLATLYHPIGSAGEPLASLNNIAPTKPIKLLYVSRISVRKGVEHIVELSKRLDDLHGQVEIDVIGDRSQWSDYTGHLKDLNPRIARRAGNIKHTEMQAVYDAADILLLPSMYEPGGLVVGEALSRGMTVVASDEVGSAEPVDPACCIRFPAGDMDAFERCTRQFIAERQADRDRLRSLAASEAETHFAPNKIAQQFVALLERASHETDAPYDVANHRVKG